MRAEQRLRAMDEPIWQMLRTSAVVGQPKASGAGIARSWLIIEVRTAVNSDRFGMNIGRGNVCYRPEIRCRDWQSGPGSPFHKGPSLDAASDAVRGRHRPVMLDGTPRGGQPEPEKALLPALGLPQRPPIPLALPTIRCPPEHGHGFSLFQIEIFGLRSKSAHVQPARAPRLAKSNLSPNRSARRSRRQGRPATLFSNQKSHSMMDFNS